MTPALDHLVVVAPSLEAGVRWCEDTLGVTPGPGGEHPLMGTHNRLLRIDSDIWPSAYLEIIAINKGAAPAIKAPARRWFDLDDADFRAQIEAQGPQLAHWVARVPAVQAVVAHWRTLQIDRGDPVEASRATPAGELHWRITVRPDGARLFGGCLPTLIQWGAVHPVGAMPASPLRLMQLEIVHPQAATLHQALAAAGLTQVRTREGPQPALRATLQTPLGVVPLTSATN